ncbi:MAG: hypothetical protein L0271_23825 [Gemmatimonadetes bacterium]|nr:hypothetical protein [Gemmatimonadota bacterium]
MNAHPEPLQDPDEDARWGVHGVAIRGLMRVPAVRDRDDLVADMIPLPDSGSARS